MTRAAAPTLPKRRPSNPERSLGKQALIRDVDHVSRPPEGMEARHDSPAPEAAQRITDPVPVPKDFWRWEHGWRIDFEASDALHGIRDEEALPFELVFVRQVLERASATRIEERTRGVDAVRGVLEQLDYRGLRPPALDLAQPHTRVVSRSRSRYEDHSSIW